ncbi:hypothetical protein QJS10_CPB18g00735 [Acorus calamus]|uniref:DUF4283 domain-containing protein n=1 Tax=Acorus calamus TaxID=4465 RepID=A0AAV9CJ79_ACOCL|nr:hypothetical protein QJS10_CPB18g00735 [Acorus calamus]
MTYTAPTMDGNRPVVEVEEADYIIGKTPVYTPFLQFLKRLWKPKGEFNLMLKGNGFFVVTFDNEEDLEEVLEGWSIL